MNSNLIKVFIALALLTQSISTQAQKRLEFLTSNIPAANFTTFADSYLWVKNWWLTAGMVPDTSKGGIVWSANSQLNKKSIDSIHKQFVLAVSPEIIRFGNLEPRIEFVKSPKQKLYIKSVFYELNDSSIYVLGGIYIEFEVSKHNKMNDVYSIRLIPAEDVSPSNSRTLRDLYARKPTEQESYITPPPISR